MDAAPGVDRRIGGVGEVGRRHVVDRDAHADAGAPPGVARGHRVARRRGDGGGRPGDDPGGRVQAQPRGQRRRDRVRDHPAAAAARHVRRDGDALGVDRRVAPVDQAARGHVVDGDGENHRGAAGHVARGDQVGRRGRHRGRRPADDAGGRVEAQPCREGWRHGVGRRDSPVIPGDVGRDGRPLGVHGRVGRVGEVGRRGVVDGEGQGRGGASAGVGGGDGVARGRGHRGGRPADDAASTGRARARRGGPGRRRTRPPRRRRCSARSGRWPSPWCTTAGLVA